MSPLLSDILFGLVAILIGTAVTLGLYWLLDRIVQRLPQKLRERLRSMAFLLPAAALLIVVLVLPLFQTVIWSFMDKKAKSFVGLQNYVELFTSADFLSVLLNNLLWILIVPAVTVGIGVIFANLSNNVGPTRERIFKSLIFMPMTISFVAASTIWGYIYVNPAAGRPKIGLLSAIVEYFGGTPQNWMQIDAGRLNSFLMMAIIVWLQVGYSMVIISAGIKAIPEETIEAARIDGANAFQLFFRVIVPQIWATIMSVFVTVLILVMKIFDIVLAMTGGNFNTNVLALEYYNQFIVFSNLGSASAVVTILLILIAPLMWLQIRTVRRAESMR